ncbi:hypothetical protein [Streptomyces albogriseolus]|uniref:hypothetical protein n=1 Tax=Streptomyces albogriseolus TaxID=1887 RepID=UPI0034600A58
MKQRRTVTEDEVGAEAYHRFGPTCWSRDGRQEWTEEDKAAAWSIAGELVEFDGYYYDVEGRDSERVENGKTVPAGYWSPYRLPRNHWWVRGKGSGSSDHVNEGEGLPTKEKALALARKDAARRKAAGEAFDRHPPVLGPVPFSAGVEIRELEPGYWEVTSLGRRWRRWNPVRPQKGRDYPASAERCEVARPPLGQLYVGTDWELGNHLERGAALAGVISPETICLLGVTRPDTDCALCEPGPAWNRHKMPKIRVGAAGLPDLDEVLCLFHAVDYIVLPEEQMRGGPKDRELLKGWLLELAEDAEAGHGSMRPDAVGRRWAVHLASVQEREEDARREQQSVQIAQGKPVGCLVTLSKNGRRAFYKGREFTVVRDGALYAARDGRELVCEGLPKAAFARAIRDWVDGGQGELFAPESVSVTS